MLKGMKIGSFARILFSAKHGSYWSWKKLELQIKCANSTYTDTIPVIDLSSPMFDLCLNRLIETILTSGQI